MRLLAAHPIHSAILAQAKIQNFGMNIYFLIGALFALVLLLILGVAAWTGFNVWIFRTRQKKSMEEYYQRTRRADGKMYPPFTGGICDECGRVQKVVYHLPTGPRLCKDCYEPHWRQAERWVDPQTTPESGLHAPSEQNQPRR